MQTKRRLVVPIAALVIAIAMIGTAYAITNIGETQSIGNSTTDAYVTITPTSSAMYTGVFNGIIYYDTHDNNGTLTYSLTDGQGQDLGNVCHDAIPLGEITLRVQEVNEDADYRVTIVGGTGMVGTFYVGCAVSSTNSGYGQFTYSAYDVDDGATFGTFDSDYEYVKLVLFIDGSFHTGSSESRTTAPLTDVAFTFSASVTN